MNESVDALFKEYDPGYRTTKNGNEQEWWASNLTIWLQLSQIEGRAYLSVQVPKEITGLKDITVDNRDYDLDEGQLKDALRLLTLYLQNINNLYLYHKSTHSLFKKTRPVVLLKKDDEYYSLEDATIDRLLSPMPVEAAALYHIH